MKLSATLLESTRNILACVSVLLLPWQTRFVSHEVWLNGYPWEQGRWAFYAVWVVMIGLIFVVPAKAGTHPMRTFRGWVPAVAGTTVLLLHSSFPPATAQWLVQVLLLITWASAMRSLAIPREKLFCWFAWSLLPVGILAIVQWFTQHVSASTFFGIASHIPSDHGAFIVETVRGRWLRAYGVFPHPNILGAWFAVLALGALHFFYRTSSRLYASIAVLACIPLFFSQSRSAILALVLACSYILFVKKEQALKKTMVLMMGVFLVLSATYSWVVIPRVSTHAPAETRSISERALAFHQGWEMFKQHPWLGSGSNASGMVWYALHPWKDTQANGVPYIPVHNAFVLLWIELGILGSIGALFLWYRYRHAFSLPFSFILLLFVFSLFDHALWSWWSGQALVVITLLFSKDPVS